MEKDIHKKKEKKVNENEIEIVDCIKNDKKIKIYKNKIL